MSYNMPAGSEDLLNWQVYLEDGECEFNDGSLCRENGVEYHGKCLCDVHAPKCRECGSKQSPESDDEMCAACELSGWTRAFNDYMMEGMFVDASNAMREVKKWKEVLDNA